MLLTAAMRIIPIGFLFSCSNHHRFISFDPCIVAAYENFSCNLPVIFWNRFTLSMFRLLKHIVLGTACISFHIFLKTNNGCFNKETKCEQNIFCSFHNRMNRISKQSAFGENRIKNFSKIQEKYSLLLLRTDWPEAKPYLWALFNLFNSKLVECL